MATRSEQFHAAEQRQGAQPAKAKKKTQRSTPKRATRTNAHAWKKATYALEPRTKGRRPSRKSSRKSANRSKADTNLTLREGRQKGSPASRSGKARAKKITTRGGS